MDAKRAERRAERPEVEEAEPTRVRVETGDELESAPHAATEARFEHHAELRRVGKPMPAVDVMGLVALSLGLAIAAGGLVLAMIGISLCLDRWSPDWGAGVGIMGVGLLLGVLPGLVSSGLGMRRIRDHLLVRRLVTVARGNDSIDLATLARMLDVDVKKARRLAFDAIGRGLLDARVDVHSERLILRPRTSPFR